MIRKWIRIIRDVKIVILMVTTTWALYVLAKRPDLYLTEIFILYGIAVYLITK